MAMKLTTFKTKPTCRDRNYSAKGRCGVCVMTSSAGFPCEGFPDTKPVQSQQTSPSFPARKYSVPWYLNTWVSLDLWRYLGFYFRKEESLHIPRPSVIGIWVLYAQVSVIESMELWGVSVWVTRLLYSCLVVVRGTGPILVQQLLYHNISEAGRNRPSSARFRPAACSTERVQLWGN